MIDAASEREAVVREARSWTGTAFHHQARLKGVGVDCVNLLIAVYCDALHLVPPVAAEGYPPDWFLHRDAERIETGIAPYFVRVPAPALGDVGLFRYGRAASHSGIVVAPPPHVRVVHSFAKFGVLETEVEPGHHLWTRRAGWWALRRWRTAEETAA